MHGHKCKLVPNVHAMQQELEEQVTYDIEEQQFEERAEPVTEGDQAIVHLCFCYGLAACSSNSYSNHSYQWEKSSCTVGFR